MAEIEIKNVICFIPDTSLNMTDKYFGCFDCRK